MYQLPDDFDAVFRENSIAGLRGGLVELFGLLLMIDPVPDAYDVRWQGPYFVPRRRIWCPSHFVLYGGRIYGILGMGSTELQISWDTGSGEYRIERGLGGSCEYADPESVWARAVPQLTRKIHSALRNPEAFNRRVARAPLFRRKCCAGPKRPPARVRRQVHYPR